MRKDNQIQLRISSDDKSKLEAVAKQKTKLGTITELLDEYIQKLINEYNTNNNLNESEPL